MDAIKNLALFGLIALAGIWVYNEKYAKAEVKEEVVEVAEAEPLPEPAFTPAAPMVVPEAAPEPVEELPSQWYTTRRITHTTAEGIAAIPAGEPVDRVSEAGAMFAVYQGRKLPAKDADFTTISPRLQEAPQVSSKPAAGKVAAAASAMPTPSVKQQGLTEEQYRQRHDAITAINLRIGAVKKQLRAEEADFNYSRIRGRATWKGPLIEKLRKEISELEMERKRLLRPR